MRVRACDRCGCFMKIGEPFIKVCRSQNTDKKQELKTVGDLCENCWEDVIGVKNGRKKS